MNVPRWNTKKPTHKKYESENKKTLKVKKSLLILKKGYKEIKKENKD